ncbi:Splicing factor U2AF 23 kDa subunit [Yarrowia sp. C11]|nr:Splicing factor U2AF 23 kDa subunit [Yarrowia sp. C11]KAG5364809.1 Splicing factor U2AF 23 kDa subunit [Yarrowia sp. E02]
MASHQASIYGTENDKVNCSFYYKIGACRHGEKCSRKHVKPTYSNTVLCSNLYQNPANVEGDPLNEDGSKMTKADLDKHFALFYEDIYMEAAKLGRLDEMIVCENGNDHLTGNTYLRFRSQEDAQKACDLFNTRWYGGRPVWCELSPVNDFTESCCRQHDTNECSRGNMCNFMHAKRPPRQLARDLDASQRKFYNRQRDRKKR